jgi:hypothetical protein
MGFCMGTTWTVTSRTSERKRLRTEPRSRMSSASGGLAEDDVGDVLLLGEAMRASETLLRQDDLGAEVAGHA